MVVFFDRCGIALVLKLMLWNKGAEDPQCRLQGNDVLRRAGDQEGMMRRFIHSIVVLALLNTGWATAAEEEKGGAEITAALKMWVNEWKHVDPGTGRTVSDSVIALVGPAVEAEFRNGAVVEASYLTSLSEYEFSKAGAVSESDRRDFDLAIGKWYRRSVGFFAGYRNSSFREKGAGSKESSYGMTYGLRGTFSLRGDSLLYGNLTYLDTRFKAEGLAREEAPGWTTEIGGRTAFTKHLALKLGYKWETTEGETSKAKDSFRGTVLDLVYAF